MWKKLLLMLALAGLVGPLHAADNDSVLVYSARAEQLIKPVFEAFTKETGIEVRYFNGSESALIERLKAEGEKSSADLLLTVDAGNLWYAADQELLVPLDNATIKSNIPAHLRDPQGRWTGLSVRARTIVYHKDRVKPDALSTYEDLASPTWKDRLCLRSSKKVYNKSLVASIIAHLGAEKAEAIVSGWVDNLALQPLGDDTQVLNAILSGQCDVGVVNSYYFGRMQAQRPDIPLGIFWANQTTTGTHVNVSGAGLLTHAKHPEAATRLLEWLTGPSAQGMFAAMNKEYPANDRSPIDKMVHEWGSFKQDQLNLAEIGALQADAVKLNQRAKYR